MRIGLTGGIGSGKSTVAAMLSDLGATLIDTDAISRAITLPGGAAIPAIRSAFGADVLDAAGGLDRARMRDIVFAQTDAKRRLEAVLHPLIGIETERQATAAAGTTIVFDVPLLVESKRWRRIVDRVLVVDASEATQLTRVVTRSGWAPDAVRAVIAQQAPRRERRAAADAVVFNDGLSLEALAGEVRSLWAHWLRHSAP